MPNIIDSSAWLEYFIGSKYAKHFENVIENTNNLLVPSVTIYEVFKKILLEQNEHEALKKIAHMKQGLVIDLNLELALSAGKLSSIHKIPMADSIILATAKKHQAVIWTMDEDFKNLPNLKYFPKK